MPHRLAVAALAGALLLCGAGCSGDGETDRPTTSAARVDELVQQGLDQLGAGRTDNARATFERVLAADADNAYAHYNLGLIAQRAGDDARAMQEYDAALAAQPDLGSALYNKGILTESADLPAAVALYRRAVAAEPDFAPAHMRLGFALLHLGSTADGEAELAAGVRLDPSMTDVQAPSYG